MNAYEEALKRMGLMRSHYMRTMRGTQMAAQQPASPSYTAATKQEPQAPSYANKYYSAQKMQSAGVSKPLQTFQSLVSTGVTPTARPSLAINNASTTYLLSKEIPVYKKAPAHRRTRPYIQTPKIDRRRLGLIGDASYIKSAPQNRRKLLLEEGAALGKRVASKLQKNPAKLQAADKTQQAHSSTAKDSLLAGGVVGLLLGMLGSGASRPQQTQHQQPVQQRAPAQQAQAMAPQQRTVPQYTVLRAQVVSPYQAARSNGLAQLLRDINRYQALRAAKQQQKQYPLQTMQNRSHTHTHTPSMTSAPDS